MNRDGKNESIWQQSIVNNNITSALNENKVYDVVIAGAGITGITTALLLQQAGKSVLIAEACNLGFGTSGGTSAHLNNFFDSSYDEVISKFGLENAKLFAAAGMEAMEMIKQHVKQYNIDCSYRVQTGYIFSVSKKQDKILDELIEGTKKVGIEIDYINDSPFPIPYRKIALIPGQAQFNPIQYLDALAGLFKKEAGTILKNCRIIGAEDGDIITVKTTQGDIRAGNLVYATHIPPGVNLLHFRNAPYRSYVLAATLVNGKYPKALGYDLCDPYHYYRTQNMNGQDYLLIGGEDHKTGHVDNTENCFRSLEAYARKYFDIDTVTFKWSSQYFIPADGLPYIGHLPGSAKNIYTATGFNGNGMMLGTISGRIITDLILTGTSRYKELFDPARVKPVAGFQNFVKEAADVVAHLIGDRINVKKIKEFADMATGEARLVRYEGNLIGIYKDEQHNLHAINAACSHIKCTVAWNNTERTWDCPCHGSRFSVDGEMLNAPARKDLEQLFL